MITFDALCATSAVTTDFRIATSELDQLIIVPVKLQLKAAGTKFDTLDMLRKVDLMIVLAGRPPP